MFTLFTWCVHDVWRTFAHIDSTILIVLLFQRDAFLTKIESSSCTILSTVIDLGVFDKTVNGCHQNQFSFSHKTFNTLIRNLPGWSLPITKLARWSLLLLSSILWKLIVNGAQNSFAKVTFGFFSGLLFSLVQGTSSGNGTYWIWALCWIVVSIQH